MTADFALTTPHPAEVLKRRGLVLPADDQVYVDRTVDLERLHPGAVLCPGTRLSGAVTFVASGAVVGSEGPATLIDCALDAESEFCSGFGRRAVLLTGARAGGSAHLRPTTILEEGASTAHAVGLKQSVLMAYVTFGSLINACDMLVSGGTSSHDHSEVGSGFIHFNFTPWGERGDKATPSLIGNVEEGAFLHRRRIFIGGLSGMVGPVSVGFGAITIAGQVIRDDVGTDRLYGVLPRRIDREQQVGTSPRVSAGKVKANIAYIGQLCALHAWYRQVRLPRASAGAGRPEVVLAGIGALEEMIDERLARLRQYSPAHSTVRGDLMTASCSDEASAIVVDRLCATNRSLAHPDWVRALDEGLVDEGMAWLAGVGRRANLKMSAAPEQ